MSTSPIATELYDCYPCTENDFGKYTHTHIVFLQQHFVYTSYIDVFGWMCVCVVFIEAHKKPKLVWYSIAY